MYYAPETMVGTHCLFMVQNLVVAYSVPQPNFCQMLQLLTLVMMT